MTDDNINSTPANDPAPNGGPEPAVGDGGPSTGHEGPSVRGREWLAQLQEMIDRVAAEAGPVARDVAAKAAELAAVAGEKAGPFARRAADVTGDVGTRVAERSRRFADDMRHPAAEDGSPPDAPGNAASGADAVPTPDAAPVVPPAEGGTPA
jgi:hypothetical protein